MPGRMYIVLYIKSTLCRPLYGIIFRLFGRNFIPLRGWKGRIASQGSWLLSLWAKSQQTLRLRNIITSDEAFQWVDWCGQYYIRWKVARSSRRGSNKANKRNSTDNRVKMRKYILKRSQIVRQLTSNIIEPEMIILCTKNLYAKFKIKFSV